MLWGAGRLFSVLALSCTTTDNSNEFSRSRACLACGAHPGAYMRLVGARNDPLTTLALDRRRTACQTEPYGRVDDLEVVKPQKAK